MPAKRSCASSACSKTMTTCKTSMPILKFPTHSWRSSPVHSDCLECRRSGWAVTAALSLSRRDFFRDRVLRKAAFRRPFFGRGLDDDACRANDRGADFIDFVPPNFIFLALHEGRVDVMRRQRGPQGGQLLREAGARLAHRIERILRGRMGA